MARESLCRRVLNRHHSVARLALLRNASRPGGHGGQKQQTEQAIKTSPTRQVFRMRHRRNRRPPKWRSRRSPPANRRRRPLRAQVRRSSGSTPSGRSRLVANVALQQLTARLYPAGEQAIFHRLCIQHQQASQRHPHRLSSREAARQTIPKVLADYRTIGGTVCLRTGMPCRWFPGCSNARDLSAGNGLALERYEPFFASACKFGPRNVDDCCPDTCCFGSSAGFACRRSACALATAYDARHVAGPRFRERRSPGCDQL